MLALISNYETKSILIAGLLIALVLTIGLGSRVPELRYDGEPKNIFQFEDKIYDDYQRLLASYPTAESAIVIVIIGDVFAKPMFDSIADFETKASRIDGVVRFSSIRSLPQVESVLIDPFTMEPLEEVGQASLLELKQSLSNTLNFFTNDEHTAQMVLVDLHPAVLKDGDQLELALGRLQSALEQASLVEDLEYHFTGLAAMKVAVDQQLSHDTVLINIVGSLAATMVAFILFRSFAVLAVLAIGPSLGVVWTLGFMHYNGDDISVLTSILPPLVFVLGYTNVAHIIFALLRNQSVASPWERSRQAITKVAKACFLSSLTTGIGFSSLMFSDSQLINQFGFYCALGCGFMFLAVMLATPSLIVIFKLDGIRDKRRILSLCERPLGILADWVQAKHRSIVLVGLLGFVALITLGLQNHSDYRFTENFSKDNSFYRSLQRTDEYFAGSLSANVLIEWQQEGAEIDLARLIRAQNAVSDHVKEVFGDVRIASLATLVDTLPKGQVNSFRQLDLVLPTTITKQFLNLPTRNSQVIISVSDEGSRQLTPKFDEVQARLRQLEIDYPELDFSLTGIAPLSAYASNNNIGELVISLAIALVVIFVVISLSLKSLVSGLVCMVPNMLPLAALAALLWLFGQPLYFSNLLVFTICLGIAVDDTVHFVIRYRQLLNQGVDQLQALKQTISQIGLVLIFTTLILSAGFFSLLFSGIGVVNLMGKLAITALCLALISDLIFLPALISRRAALAKR